MSRALRLLGILLVVVVVVVALGALGIYARAGQILGRTWTPAGTAVPIPTDSASIAEGQRLATTLGCYADCHGESLEGAVIVDDASLGYIVSPNLSTSVRRRSDAELEGIIRRGVRPDGKSVIAMPTASYSELTDEDLGRILAFLKSQPEAPGPEPEVRLGPIGRLAVATGRLVPGAAQVVPEAIGSPGLDKSDPRQLGRYLVRTHCRECHGPALRGMSVPGGLETPDLKKAAEYSPDEFHALLRRGMASDAHDLERMGEVIRTRFTHFTDEEIAAMHAFLRDSLR